MDSDTQKLFLEGIKRMNENTPYESAIYMDKSKQLPLESSVILTGISCEDKDRGSAYWVTAKDARKKFGTKPRDGEKGVEVVVNDNGNPVKQELYNINQLKETWRFNKLDFGASIRLSNKDSLKFERLDNWNDKAKSLGCNSNYMDRELNYLRDSPGYWATSQEQFSRMCESMVSGAVDKLEKVAPLNKEELFLVDKLASFYVQKEFECRTGETTPFNYYSENDPDDPFQGKPHLSSKRNDYFSLKAGHLVGNDDIILKAHHYAEIVHDMVIGIEQGKSYDQTLANTNVLMPINNPVSQHESDLDKLKRFGVEKCSSTDIAKLMENNAENIEKNAQEITKLGAIKEIQAKKVAEMGFVAKLVDSITHKPGDRQDDRLNKITEAYEQAQQQQKTMEEYQVGYQQCSEIKIVQEEKIADLQEKRLSKQKEREQEQGVEQDMTSEREDDDRGR